MTKVGWIILILVLLFGGALVFRTRQENGEKPAPKISGKGELVKPAERDPKKWGDARCNDGSPFGFQVQLADSNDWVVYLKGGGFCDDNGFDCSERKRGDNSKTAPLTTTPPGKDGDLGRFIKQTGFFNPNRAQNLIFYNANKVYAIYCSSDAWMGSTETRHSTVADPKGWYFSGRKNIEAMLEILTEKYGLDDSNKNIKVLFSGESGGGHGVHANIDTLVSLMPNASRDGRIKLVVDAGSQIDFDDPNYRPGNSSLPMTELWKKAYEFWGAKENELCEEGQKKKGEHPSSCSFAPINDLYLGRYGVSVLYQQSSIDKDIIRWHHIDPEDPHDKDALEKFRTTTLNAFENVDWFFSGGSYPYHTILTSDTTREGWNMGPRGNTFKEVLARFWEGGKPERVIFGNP